MAQAFVARERELYQLQTFLARTLEGKGQAAFIVGEAGSGKTALVREFARIAQEAHAELVVAVGECNAQSGIGDPYLPFREILGLLSGDIETKLAQGAITQENAKRLRAALRLTGQALVEIGPTLINTLVPGTLLMTMGVRFLAGKAGWLKSLQQLNERKAASPNENASEQEHLFEQYANVLKALAAKQPLVLILDDLQWVDVASASLLFHLGRRIGASRILLLGTYRPEEVALGRGEERHPLDKVLAEFKRSFGEIEVSLGESGETEARHFVEALLDSEPNQLGTEFREAVFQHTCGHALFTVELLRTLQERGDLVQDAQGRWVVGPSLDWGTLPARVEGVIEERLGRLDETQHELLRAASVEGLEFIAEVVAALEQMQLRPLLRELSQNLDKRHRLVRETGELRLGKQRLAAFRFAHALFQQALYGELGAGERRLLHGEVARMLEQLYTEQKEQVCVQLAWHYDQAGEEDKAIEYLLQAGERAKAQGATLEARKSFQRVLQLLPLPEASVHVPARATALLRLGNLDFDLGDYGSARAHLREALAICREQSNDAGSAEALYILGCAAYYQKKYWRARVLYESSLSVSRACGAKRITSDAMHMLGHVMHGVGDPAQAHALFEESVASYRALGDWKALALPLSDLAREAQHAGDFTKARSIFEDNLGIFEESGEKWGMGLMLADLGYLALATHDLSAAQAHLQKSLSLFQQIGDKRFIAECLEGFAGLAVAEGQPTRAARLFGAAEALRQVTGIPVPPYRQPDYERFRSSAEAALDQTALRRECAAGQALSLDQAIAYALETNLATQAADCAVSLAS